MPQSIVFPGARFGRLTVVEIAGKCSSSYMWRVKCDCGTEKIIYQQQLSHTRKRSTKSCGCLGREIRSASRTVHGACKNGRSTPEYVAWCSMRRRCKSVALGGHPYYGGRGISVCERWCRSFENFYADMGPRPSSGHSLERIDVNGHYEPANCKWGTAREQSRNTRHSAKYTINGKKMSLVEMCELTGMCKSAMARRIKSLGPEMAMQFAKHKTPQKRRLGEHNIVYEYNGMEVCVNQLAKMAGVAHCVMRRRLRTMTPEDAVSMERKRPTNRGRSGYGRNLIAIHS